MSNPDATLMNEILLANNRGCIAQVAERAGMAERTVYDYCHARRSNIPVALIRAAWLVTHDARLKRALEPDGYELTARPAGMAGRSWEKEINDVSLALGNVLTEVRAALEDGNISPRQKNTIQGRIDAVRHELADLEAMLKEGK